MTYIRGYRQLSKHEIDLINEVKDMAEKVGDLINRMSCMNGIGREDDGVLALDQRWVHIAKTDLQKGFMSLTRAIAKPESF